MTLSIFSFCWIILSCHLLLALLLCRSASSLLNILFCICPWPVSARKPEHRWWFSPSLLGAVSYCLFCFQGNILQTMLGSSMIWRRQSPKHTSEFLLYLLVEVVTKWRYLPFILFRSTTRSIHTTGTAKKFRNIIRRYFTLPTECLHRKATHWSARISPVEIYREKNDGGLLGDWIQESEEDTAWRRNVGGGKKILKYG